jgi:hypothetical protein
VKQLEALKLTDFPGENVNSVSKLFRAAMVLLRNYNDYPKNMSEIVFEILQAAATESFKACIGYLKGKYKTRTKCCWRQD